MYAYTRTQTHAHVRAHTVHIILQHGVILLCSSGVAQTGTFVALDRLLQHIVKHDWVDVYSTVCEMRQYRRFMVRHEVWFIAPDIIHCQLSTTSSGAVSGYVHYRDLPYISVLGCCHQLTVVC